MVSFSNFVQWPVTDVITHWNKTAVSDHHLQGSITVHICKVQSILRSCVAIVWVINGFSLTVSDKHTCKVTSFLSVIPSAMHLSCSKILLFNSQCALANLKETIKHANWKEDNSIKNLPHVTKKSKDHCKRLISKYVTSFWCASFSFSAFSNSFSNLKRINS